MDNEQLKIFRELTISADAILEYDTPKRILDFMHTTEKALKTLGLSPSGWGSYLASRGFEIENVE